MKTIKEGAEIYSQSNEYQKSNSLNRFENIFKAGVEFAQRWISVEDEELPKIGDDIILKLKSHPFKKYQVWHLSNENDVYLVKIYATHWRPIEL